MQMSAHLLISSLDMGRKIVRHNLRLSRLLRSDLTYKTTLCLDQVAGSHIPRSWTLD